MALVRAATVISRGCITRVAVVCLTCASGAGWEEEDEIRTPFHQGNRHGDVSASGWGLVEAGEVAEADPAGTLIVLGG